MGDKTLELQIRIAAEDAARIVSALKDDFKALADEAGNFAKKEGEELKQKFKETEEAAKDSAKSIDDIFKAMGRLTEIVAATKALSFIKDMGSFALSTADNFQTMKNQFGILLQDMDAGAGLFAEIKAFGDITPFDLDTLTQATNVLVSAKVPLSDLQNQLTKFGDLSQGNSQRLTSYINAFSQASAKGKADMQVLNTYLNQGVPILDALAKNFGVTTAEVLKMSSEGQISFVEFSRALDDLTAAGGQYFGGMELASKSLAAMQEGLSEAVNTLGASFGEMLLPAAIAVVQVLTDITNAINESPLLKGLLVGAIVALTGYLGAMAIKAGIAFAQQMALNFSIGALNPVVMAATVAVAAIAAGYTMMASNAQKAAKDADVMAISQRRVNDAMRDGIKTIGDYYESITQAGFGIEITARQIENLREKFARERAEYAAASRDGAAFLVSNDTSRQLEAQIKYFKDLRKEFIEDYYTETVNEEVKKLQDKISDAQTLLLHVDISPEEERQLKNIIIDLQKEINEINGNIGGKASAWAVEWSEVWKQFKAEQANDPFYAIELERTNKINDARKNGILTNSETMKQVNEFYNLQRSAIIQQLYDEENRLQRELSNTKIDDIQHEFEEALRAISKLEEQRIIAAGDSEAEIAAIRESFSRLREDTSIKYTIEIDQAALDEARESIKTWQEVLSDNLLTSIMNLEMFSDQASVILADLTAQLIEMSGAAMLSGFEEFGRALGEGEDAAESMSRALTQMSAQILKQLPMMFLQAGLQLIANGQWALGLGFIAAAGSSAIISGYVDGATSRAQEEAKEVNKHAQGGVFEEYGQAARAFASGGAFTNQIVSTPTFFRYGGSLNKLGEMGEAGPEAIVPLTRMPNGNLGVQTSGTGTNVEVKIINLSGEPVRQEETERANGDREIEVIIGEAVNKHIASGKADRIMAGRYGSRHLGV